MTLEQFELMVDCTPPRIYVVEWAFSLRSMYALTGIEPYNIVANILSDILEDFPTISRVSLCNTPVVEKILSRLLLTNANDLV